MARRKPATKDSMELLKANVTHATERLIEILDQPKPSSIHFNAAMAIIKIVYENEQIIELQKQVKELEKGANREP